MFHKDRFHFRLLWISTYSTPAVSGGTKHDNTRLLITFCSRMMKTYESVMFCVYVYVNQSALSLSFCKSQLWGLLRVWSNGRSTLTPSWDHHCSISVSPLQSTSTPLNTSLSLVLPTTVLVQWRIHGVWTLLFRKKKLGPPFIHLDRVDPLFMISGSK